MKRLAYLFILLLLLLDGASGDNVQRIPGSLTG